MPGRTNNRVAPVIGVLLLFAACGGDADEARSVARSTEQAPVDSTTSETDESVAIPAAEPGPLDAVADHFRPITVESVTLDPVTTTESAVDVVFHPLDDAMHVVEHAGRVVRVDGDRRDVVLDISERLVGHADEQGLTGLEFSRDGATAWVHYTLPDGTTTISEMDVADDATFDPASERMLFEIDDSLGLNHNSGDLLRADDDTLYITIGDGAAGVPDPDGRIIPEPDPNRVANDPATLRGSILRVRPTPDGPVPYTIPDDNPFAGGPLVTDAGGEVDGAPEVFAWGLRNPWKIDIDKTSGTLWVADVGDSAFEEINVVAPADGRRAGWADDFGWSAFEGTEVRNADVSPAGDEPVDPILEYDHEDGGCAISGGVVYRGDAIADLWSGYVYADFCAGTVSVLDVTTGEERQIADGVAGISAVRAGPDGELYVSSWFGDVLRIEAS